MLLHGYNQLTKSLVLSLYKLDYIACNESKTNYIKRINNEFCANKLADMLTEIAHTIGGQVLNRAIRNYQPQGASATLMIAEASNDEANQPMPSSIVAHLDKSHLCIHTYPEELFTDNIAIFRADIDISSCGLISPLVVLNNIIDQYSPDIVNIDYRVRGFNRQVDKTKQFIDHEIGSIQAFLSPQILEKYQTSDNNLAKINFFHTSLMTEKIEEHRAFTFNNRELNASQKSSIKNLLTKQLKTLFKGTV
jgi:S-adenosylmethionine decarboxylase